MYIYIYIYIYIHIYIKLNIKPLPVADAGKRPSAVLVEVKVTGD